LDGAIRPMEYQILLPRSLCPTLRRLMPILTRKNRRNTHPTPSKYLHGRQQKKGSKFDESQKERKSRFRKVTGSRCDGWLGGWLGGYKFIACRIQSRPAASQLIIYFIPRSKITMPVRATNVLTFALRSKRVRDSIASSTAYKIK